MYIKLPEFHRLSSYIEEYTRLACERGADPSQAVAEAEMH